MGDVIDALTNRRREIDVTQRAVSLAIGRSPSLVSMWEGRRRTPGADDLDQWAGSLGCRVVLRVDPTINPPVLAYVAETYATKQQQQAPLAQPGRAAAS